MPRRKADPETALASDDTFEMQPASDEAILPRKGVLKPERVRDGTAESSDLHDLAQRAAESGDGLEEPLDFGVPKRRRRRRTARAR